MDMETRLQNEGERILLNALLRNREAFARIKDIARQFPEMASMPSIGYSILKEIPDGVDQVRVDEYTLELRKLADHYNLKCDWIINRLHYLIRQLINPSCNLYVVTWATREIDRFKLDVPIHPYTRKPDVQQAFRKEWQRIAANPEFRSRLKPPANFELAVEWLALRCIYGYTANRIEQHGKTLQTIKHLYGGRNYLANDIVRATRKAAAWLDIKLPKGRPRKSRKR